MSERIEVDLAEYVHLCADAAQWRTLEACPHTAELLEDWVEWHRRASCRQASHAISGACDWRKHAKVPTYRELERRRSTYPHPALSPAEIRSRAAASWDELDRSSRRAA